MSGAAKDRWNLRGFLLFGYLTLAALVLGIGTWSVTTQIAGAVIAAGSVEVKGNRQVVQHPTGGVIAAIHVRDGDTVAAGDVLVELDGDELHAELGIVEGQWFEILARKGRLSAERDLAERITFDQELLDRAADTPGIDELLAAQQQQFDARRKVQQEEINQLNEREAQIAKQIEGLESLRRSNVSQIDLLSQEIDGQETLLAQGLTQLTRVLTPQRELARLRGTDGQVEAAIAENRGKIAETAIERVRLVSKTREAAIDELRDLEFREIELRERRRTLIDQIERLQLRAPVAGIVYDNSADTLRAVIRPADPVLYIVPSGAELIVRVQIDTVSINKVHVGQSATLRYSAFDMRTTPEVEGTVVGVSADAFEDPQTRMRFYRADIAMTEAAREELAGLEILPGMPVEAFIKTEDRSPLAYLVKPMTDYFMKAFRES